MICLGTFNKGVGIAFSTIIFFSIVANSLQKFSSEEQRVRTNSRTSCTKLSDTTAFHYCQYKQKNCH